MNKTTALIFFGILLVGISISLFTLKGCGDSGTLAEEKSDSKPARAIDEGTTPPEPSTAAAPPAAPSPATPDPAPASPAKPEAPASPPVAGFKSPEAAMAALAEKIGQKDFEGFATLAGKDVIPDSIRAQVKELVENPDLKLDPAKPHVEISKSAEALRWAFNFVPASGDGAGKQLYTDLAQSDDETLEIAGVALPLQVAVRGGDASAESPAAAPTAPGGGAPGAPAPDALTVAHAFSKAIIQRDFATARELADPATVTDERVAALMIAVEEGDFALKEDRPLVVTLSREDITWVLARVQSESAASEFAVELGQIDQAWKVNGLTFSKVLSALSEAAGAGDVAYSPIVEDPSGGDSLVLYFEFDDSGLTPRTERQLAIVAEILNQGAERVIRINGHADALGSDNYNVTLSDRRAESIRQALIRNGVKPAQVVTEAFGAAKPRKPNFLPDGSDNPSGRSQNRRAEVLLDF